MCVCVCVCVCVWCQLYESVMCASHCHVCVYGCDSGSVLLFLKYILQDDLKF